MEMTMEGLVLLACHMVADFPLQTDRMAANKISGGVWHVAHVGVHLVVYLAVFWPLYGTPGVMAASFLAGWHGLIDSRRWAEPKEGFEHYPIWVDQSLHVATIALTLVVFG